MRQLESKGKLRRYVYFDLDTLPVTPLDIRFEFQDANGRNWQRVGSKPVKRRRHRTPTHGKSWLSDGIPVRIKEKPDFYTSGPVISRMVSPDKIADMAKEEKRPRTPPKPPEPDEEPPYSDTTEPPEPGR